MEKPILFSGAMVNSILGGGKSQTRRVLKPQPVPFLYDDKSECEVSILHIDGDPRPRITLGRVVTRQKVRWSVGDKLWVRETWSHNGDGVWTISAARSMGRGGVIYRADQDLPGCGWSPSIHMPREFSRINLDVTDVRVERLQSISETDAIAEGIRVLPMQDAADPSAWWESGPGEHQARNPVGSYAKLWDHINGAGSWDKNPFVVAISFNRVAA